MTTNELQARAIYDFVAESESELSFTAQEILSLVEVSDDNPWWSARNSLGQIGLIPSNYVEIILGGSTSIQEILAQKNSNMDMLSFSNGSSNIESETQIDNQLPIQNEQEQQNNPSSIADWQHGASESFCDDQDDPSTDSSFDSYVRTTNNENSTDLLPVTSPSSNPFVSNIDFSIPPESSTTTFPNPMQQQDASYYPSNDYLFSPIETAPPVSQLNPPLESNPVSSFLYLQPTPVEQQSIQPFTNFNDFSLSSPVIQELQQSDSTYDIPSPLPISDKSTITASESTNRSPAPVENRTANQTSTSKPLSEPKIEESAQTKAKTKNKYFTLKRQKTKTESNEKRSSFSEPSSEASAKRTTDENNADSSIASGQPLQSTASNPNKPAVSEVDAKGSPRARFFDKYGIDNYLLHGCKTKSDEHVEINFDEKEGGVHWLQNPIMRPFSCKIEEPSKSTKLAGLKSFMEYKILAHIPGSRTVGRRYKHFDWLHEQLVTKFRFICIPSLPGKQIAGRFEQEFVEERRRQLEIWLNRICRHPVLCASYPVQHFVTCELTDANNKDWKNGKRKIEKDELREASWLHCVTFSNSNLSDFDLALQIESFAQNQPSLEAQIRGLGQGLAKYFERHTEIYERDLQRLGELFAKFQKVLQTDTTTPGNQELSESTLKISASYNAIAGLYKTKASEGIRDFNERIQEYIGLLACFPSIIHIQRSAAEFMKSLQQRSPATLPDLSIINNRNHVLHHVVVAEINFFQREKVKDLHTYMKTLISEQIQFYENITAELHEAASTFS